MEQSTTVNMEAIWKYKMKKYSSWNKTQLSTVLINCGISRCFLDVLININSLVCKTIISCKYGNNLNMQTVKSIKLESTSRNKSKLSTVLINCGILWSFFDALIKNISINMWTIHFCKYGNRQYCKMLWKTSELFHLYLQYDNVKSIKLESTSWNKT